MDPPSTTLLSPDALRWSHIQKIHAECGCSVAKTARRLGMHNRTLQRIMARHRTGDNPLPAEI
jgi:two-component system response regulator RegA